MKDLIQIVASAIRRCGNIVSLFAFPGLCALVYLMYAYVYKSLTPGSQSAIENGGLGMLLGIVFGVIMVAAASASWGAAADILKSQKHQPK